MQIMLYVEQIIRLRTLRSEIFIKIMVKASRNAPESKRCICIMLQEDI